MHPFGMAAWRDSILDDSASIESLEGPHPLHDLLILAGLHEKLISGSVNREDSPAPHRSSTAASPPDEVETINRPDGDGEERRLRFSMSIPPRSIPSTFLTGGGGSGEATSRRDIGTGDCQ
jgi:hypothetical protein